MSEVVKVFKLAGVSQRYLDGIDHGSSAICLSTARKGVHLNHACLPWLANPTRPVAQVHLE